MDNELANLPSCAAFSDEKFPRLRSFRFDGVSVPGKLALIAESGAWAWVQPQFVTHLDDGIVRLELLAESGTETHGIPCDVYNIVDAYFRLDFPIFHYEVRHRERVMGQAERALLRFLDGDHRPFSYLTSSPNECVKDIYKDDPRNTEIVDIAQSIIDRLGPKAQRVPVVHFHEDIEERLSSDTARWIIAEDLKKAYGVRKRRCPEFSMLVYEFPRCAADGTPLRVA